MNDRQSTYLGRGALPRDLSGFEIEAFFTYSESERRLIDDERRSPALKLALALQIGFLRMTGRLLEALRLVPPALWRHLGAQFEIDAPDLASLRTMYRRRRTLFEQQDLACSVLGFHDVTEAQRRSLVRAINAELSRTSDRQRLLQFARRWLYDHKQIIPRERELRGYIAKAIRQHEATLVSEIIEAIDSDLLAQWKRTIMQPREDGATVQSWLWAPPAKHSTRQIDRVLERIELLTALKVDQHLAELPEAIIRRYARRLASRAPAVAARIAEPTRTIEVACFLRYSLMINTDHLLWMVRRRVADLWRKAAEEADAQRVNYERLYQQLLGELSALASDGTLSVAELQQKLNTLLLEHRERRGPSRAQIIRDHLMEEVRPVRALLKALAQQPWKGSADHPLLESLKHLNALYGEGEHALPVDTDLSLGRVWRKSLQDEDREKAFAAAEVGTLLNLRRALRNGSVWIDHSLSFRSRETLFIPPARWQTTRRAHYRRLHQPQDPAAFLEPLIERAKAGVLAVSKTAAEGILRVDEELHLTPLEPMAEDPKVTKLRAALDRRVGEAQLPELILAVDAEVRFSWIMLGREPRSSKELLMVYAGILAHGTALSAAETARMIPQLSAASVRQAMKWASDERRLAQACSAVLAFMHRHPISATWGRSDLASSDMMSMETSQRVFVARNDPRRLTPSVGIYSHTRDRWGISYAQPMVLLEALDLRGPSRELPSQAARGDAGGRRRIKPIGEPGDGVEYDEDAVGARPLEHPTFHRGADAADRANRADAHGRHKSAGRVHLPDRAIPGPTTTVTSGSQITRFWRLNGSSDRRQRHFRSEQNGHYIQRITYIPGNFPHVFKNKVPALLARKSRRPLRPRRVVLIDDVVTRGATFLGAAARIQSEILEAEIKAFALMRAITDGETEAIRDPVGGAIELDEAGESWRRP